jgi:polysaccharide biosynthesis protein PslH
LCVTTSCDVVQIEATVLGGLSVPSAVRVILDEHNIEYEVFERMSEGERSLIRRMYNRWEYQRVRRFEQQCWTRVDGCVVTSEREEPVVQRVAPDIATAVVPNGVDLEYFLPTRDAVEPNSVVFNGTLGYRPNVDAAYHLVDEVWPLVLDGCPDAKLTIVGRASDSDRRRLTRPGVVVTGEVSDIRPYVQRAAVVAVPVRMGGGTRLKVVEGLAMEKAIVSTTLGCEGVAVRDGEHLLIGDGAGEFAARILECFANPELRARLGAAGRRLTEEEYSWRLAGERLDALYKRVAGGRDERSSALITVAGAPR